MPSTSRPRRRRSADRPLRSVLPLALLTPVLGSVLGIDGGAIFQIFASENLGLSASAIGVAFGLGVVSLPVQIWAARIGLWRARRNLQLFLAIAAVQAWMLALLLVIGAGGTAPFALGITVSAEVSLSVLYATAWQPLLSHLLSSVERQQINSRGRAIGGGLLAIVLLFFAAASPTLRAACLVTVGVASVWSAIGLRRIDSPVRPGSALMPNDPSTGRSTLPPSMKPVFVALSLVNLGAWPLLLVYLHKVLWPRANLGLVAALQLAGALVASLAWRPTVSSVLIRARLAGLALVAAGFTLAAIRAPVEGRVEDAAALVAVVVAAASAATIRLVLIELAHRTIEATHSVRAFTLLDVVASSSLQLGLLAGGLLVALSSSTMAGVDPYRIFVAALAVAALVAISRLEADSDDLTALSSRPEG